MKIEYGSGQTKYGPGIDITLTPEDVVRAIQAYLVAKGIHVNGPATYRVNNTLIESARIYIDPSGFVIHKGRKISGRGDSVE
jgi:hypothetical protein